MVQVVEAQKHSKMQLIFAKQFKTSLKIDDAPISAQKRVNLLKSDSYPCFTLIFLSPHPAHSISISTQVDLTHTSHQVHSNLTLSHHLSYENSSFFFRKSLLNKSIILLLLLDVTISSFFALLTFLRLLVRLS